MPPRSEVLAGGLLLIGNHLLDTKGFRMIQAQAWGRVMRIAGERGLPGTGFALDHENVQYLVTARHLCGEEPEEQITVRHPFYNGGHACSIMLERVPGIPEAADAAVFRLPEAIAPQHLTLPFGLNGIVYGQDIYIMGYPYALSFNPHGGGDQELPIVKKGILSGSSESGGVHYLYLDIMANPGFSGGPVVFRDASSNDFKVAGIVKGQYMGPVVETDPDTQAKPAQMPSGISVATNIDCLKLAFS